MDAYTLLNPKHAKTEPGIAATDGQSLTTADVCAGLSYADLTPLQSAVLAYYGLHQNSARDALHLALASVMPGLVPAGTSADWVANVMITAIAEVDHPITQRPWSIRERAAYLGISKDKWYRSGLHSTVDRVILVLTGAMDQAESKLNQAVRK